MKKFIWLLILFLLVFCGCGDNSQNKDGEQNEEDHIHTYEKNWSFDEESHFYQANCGHDIKSNKEEHELVNEIIKEATHFEKGISKYTCSVCGYSKEEDIEIISHTFSGEYFFDENNHYYVCECGEKDKDEKHYFIEDTLKEATHFEKGTIKYTCSICGYFIEKDIEIISHTYSGEYSFDECNHYYLCECGEKDKIEEHNYGEGEVVIEETRLTEGLRRYTCKCGSTKDEVIEAKGFNVDKSKEIIYLVTTSAGEDISKSVGISWHCKDSGSYLLYYKEGTKDYVEVKPNEVYWSIEESYMTDPYQNKRYVCTVDLDNLEPNCKYIYKVICGDISSNDMSFKTSDSSSGKYSFLSFVDFQYSENAKTLNLVRTFVEKNPEANLITCSGDITDEGYSEKSHRYLFDSNVFSNSILAKLLVA